MVDWNFVARMLNAVWTIPVQATELQSAQLLQLSRAIKLRDKIAGVTSVLGYRAEAQVRWTPCSTHWR